MNNESVGEPVGKKRRRIPTVVFVGGLVASVLLACRLCLVFTMAIMVDDATQLSIQNTTDVTVLVSAGAGPPEILPPGDTRKIWIEVFKRCPTKQRGCYYRIEATDEQGAAVFCKTYTRKQLQADSYVVEITLTGNQCSP